MYSFSCTRSYVFLPDIVLRLRKMCGKNLKEIGSVFIFGEIEKAKIDWFSDATKFYVWKDLAESASPRKEDKLRMR